MLQASIHSPFYRHTGFAAPAPAPAPLPLSPPLPPPMSVALVFVRSPAPVVPAETLWPNTIELRNLVVPPVPGPMLFVKPMVEPRGEAPDGEPEGEGIMLAFLLYGTAPWCSFLRWYRSDRRRETERLGLDTEGE